MIEEMQIEGREMIGETTGEVVLVVEDPNLEISATGPSFVVNAEPVSFG